MPANDDKLKKNGVDPDPNQQKISKKAIRTTFEHHKTTPAISR